MPTPDRELYSQLAYHNLEFETGGPFRKVPFVKPEDLKLTLNSRDLEALVETRNMRFLMFKGYSPEDAQKIVSRAKYIKYWERRN